MKSKIIFFDIDGTIIDHVNKEIPKSTIDSLLKLQENNHKVAIATGKNPTFIETFLKDFNIKIDTYVALNGNYVVVNNKVVSTNYLNELAVEKLCKYCLEKDYPFSIINIDSRVTLFKDNQAISDYYSGFSLDYPKVIDKIDSYKLFQMTIMVNDEIQDQLKNMFQDLEFVRMSVHGLNVVATNGTKDRGIIDVLNNSSYSLEDVIVFGDGLNDISMFKLAPISVAMKNGNDKLKEYATFVTSDISDNGIKNALEKLKLI